MSKRCVLKLIKPCHGPRPTVPFYRANVKAQMAIPLEEMTQNAAFWALMLSSLLLGPALSFRVSWLSFSVTIFNLLPKKPLKKISIGSGRYLVTQWVSILNDPPVSDCFSSRIFHWLVLQYSSFTYSWRDIFLACSPLISSNFFINFSIVAMEA